MRTFLWMLVALAAGCTDRNLGAGSDGGSDGGGGGDMAGGEGCGGFVARGCPTGQYCEFGASCGVADQPGICQPLPATCGKNLQPSCGCDSVTYGNPCLAHQAGVSVNHDGTCATPPMGNTCGGFAGLTCAATEYCDYPDGSQCGAADASGVCTVRPQACSAIYAPVCGCDGMTYGNACEAAAAGTDVNTQGACGSTDCRQTGCPGIKQRCELCFTSYVCLDPNVAC